MAGSDTSHPCAAHNCLKPQYRDGWCVAHWYADQARLARRDDAEDRPRSLVICEAIWAVS